MRKFIFSGSLISAIIGGWGTLQTTRKGPRDWRLILMWVSWAASVALAIGTIVKQSHEADEFNELEE